MRTEELKEWKRIECILGGLRYPIYQCDCCGVLAEYHEMFPFIREGKQKCLDCANSLIRMGELGVRSNWDKAISV